MTSRFLFLLILSYVVLTNSLAAMQLPDHPRLYLTNRGGEGVISIDDAKARFDDPAFAEVNDRLKKSSAATDMALELLLTADTSDLSEIRKFMERRQGRGRSYRWARDWALVYDWAYHYFTDEERRAYRDWMFETIDNMNKRWPMKTVYLNGCRGKHMATGLIVLATLGEDPRAEQHLPDVKEQLQDFLDIIGDGVALNDMDGRAAYGGGWPEGYDYDRHASFYTLELLLAWRSCRLGDHIVGSRFWQDKIYSLLYATTPDHKRVLGFEDNDHPSNEQYQDKEFMTILGAQFNNGHARWWLDEFEKQSDTQCRPYNELLFGNPKLKAREPDNLPTSRFIPGLGLFLMRSSWEQDATFVHFHCGPFYAYHQQAAQGSFSVYREFGRIVEPGVYDNEVREHFVNWRCRTISHNCLLVFDPQEKFLGPSEIPIPANDGGQLIQKWSYKPSTYMEWRAQKESRQAGTVTYQTTDTSHDAVTGEIHNAYAAGKVKRWCRQMVFIKPDWVVLCDLVVAGNPEHRKTMVFHTPEELLSSSEGFFTMKDGQKVVEIFPMLPNDQTSLIKGGPGKSFSYGGTNWAGGETNQDPDNVWSETGGAFPDQYKVAWRLEVDAPQGDTTIYLTAIRIPGAESQVVPGKAKLIHNETSAISLSLDDGKYELSFDPTGGVPYQLTGENITYSISGNLTDDGMMAIPGQKVKLDGPVKFQAETDRHGNYAFSGLKPDQYQIKAGEQTKQIELGTSSLSCIDFSL